VELSVIVTSNLPFSQWSTAFADDQTLTAALLGRLLHYARPLQNYPLLLQILKNPTQC
jgi:DNA replication protein DnaC